MYKVLTDKEGYLLCLHRESDNAGIPIDETNKDYQEFCAYNEKLAEPIVIPPSRPEPEEMIAKRESEDVFKSFLNTPKPDVSQCADAIRAIIVRMQ